MAITKTTEVPKIEVVRSSNVQVATDTVILEDDVEISRSRHRHVLQPFTSSKDADGKWTHTDTDISGEDDTVKNICGVVWSETIKANYKIFVESQEI